MNLQCLYGTVVFLKMVSLANLNAIGFDFDNLFSILDFQTNFSMHGNCIHCSKTN